MAARPAKRQRRSTVLVSDDEDDAAESQNSTNDRTTGQVRRSTLLSKPLQTKNRSQSSFSQPASTKSSTQSSPSKSRKNSKQSTDSKTNKSLLNFFGRATDEQRWQRKADTPQPSSQDDLTVDDIVDDDSLDDYFAQLTQKPTVRSTAANATISILNGRSKEPNASTPTSSQKFAKAAVALRTHEPANTSNQPDTVTEHTPWADRFGPSSLDEIAVHKNKVAQVRKWLEDVTSGKSPQRILVLKGPAGCGKSTTVSLLARALNIEIVPWRNPVVSEVGNASSTHQFAEFLDRGGQFEALNLDGIEDASETASVATRKLLLVEEFPTTITRSSNVLDNFRSTLLQHILRSAAKFQVSKQKSSESPRPLVLVISESVLTSSTALSDSFTAHRLLGAELSHHPLLETIEFNPVAPTFILRAIDLVIKKEARESKRRRVPGPAVLQSLTSIGDVRSAINSLEFLCARDDEGAGWSGTVARVSRTSSKGLPTSTETEKNALQLIGLRESTLDMFHATGKIVYNKREDPRVLNARAELPPEPPDHLMHLYSPKISQVDIDALLNETGTDIQTFISTLHENYVLSCNGEDFVNSFARCSEFLSNSDYLDPDSRAIVRGKSSSRSHSNNQSGNSEMLRQDEISFNVASRGLLFALPFPVNRATPPGVKRQDAFKMFYPTSLRLWKPAEEIHDLISMYAKGFSDEDVASLNMSKKSSGVSSWKARTHAFTSALSIPAEDAEPGNSLVPCTSREQLSTEMLPFLARIRAAKNKDTQILRRITQLRGINISSDETFDEEQDQESTIPVSGSARLQKRVEEVHELLQAQKLQSTRNAAAKTQEHSHASTVKDAISQDKLYISDDDIQDD